MEKGQCATIASWEGGNVRSRKATSAATTPGQVNVLGTKLNNFCFMRFQ